MATTKRQYVFAAFVLSCVALALLITSMATQVWVASDLKPMGSLLSGSSVSYGLFSGRYERRMSLDSKSISSITITCLMSENVCGWSCLETSEAREKEMRELYTNGTSTAECPIEKIEPITGPKRMEMRRDSNTTDGFIADKRFLNAGLWVSTVFFSVLALVVTGIATILAVLNAATNPSRTCFAMDGLYFWNGGAAGLDLIVLILWGAQFATTAKENVAISDVIKGAFASSGLASLGYSYWLFLVSLLLSVACVVVLVVRDYLLAREPPTPTYNPDLADKDGAIFLY